MIDEHFKSAQDYTNRFGAQMGYMMKLYKRITANYTSMAISYTDLGAAYNGWSLTENELSHGIEHTGQAIDSIVTSTTTLLSQTDEFFGDILEQYSQYAKIIQKLLLWRHKKNCEFEVVSETLVAKQTLLARLESTEHESQRLSAVLNAEGISGPPVPHVRPTGIMATINSLMDNDPELSRRNQISKTKDLIHSLEEQRETIRLELDKANSEIQSSLDGIQRQKIKDIKSMMMGLAHAQKEYHARCLRAWQEAKASIQQN